MSLAGSPDHGPANHARASRLALAGCDLIRIIAITGHSAASVQMIMKHYLTLNSAMAADAIGKLVAWMEKEGVRA